MNSLLGRDESWAHRPLAKRLTAFPTEDNLGLSLEGSVGWPPVERLMYRKLGRLLRLGWRTFGCPQLTKIISGQVFQKSSLGKAGL